MGPAIADHPDDRSANRENQRSELSVHSPDSPKSGLAVFASIIDNHHCAGQIELGGFGEREPVLGLVRCILRRVEFDVHDLYVTTKLGEGKNYP